MDKNNTLLIRFTKDYKEWLSESMEKERKKKGFPSINSFVLWCISQQVKKPPR